MVVTKKDGSVEYIPIVEIDNLKFIDPGNVGSVDDIDGNTYKTVKIGNQWWMAENLRVTKYRSSVEIPNVTNSEDWRNRNTPAFCYYDNDVWLSEDYGALYNWFAVIRSDLPPKGWRIPTYEDWKILVEYLGNNGGDKLKSDWGWIDEGNGTDDYEFSALPAGYRDSDGIFKDMGFYADFWSASEKVLNNAWDGSLYFDQAEINQKDYDVRGGFSVRCIRE